MATPSTSSREPIRRSVRLKIPSPSCGLSLSRIADIAANLHANIVNDVPKLKRGLVWCLKCGREQKVDSAECLRSGWPKCCGETMSIDSPEERKQA